MIRARLKQLLPFAATVLIGVLLNVGDGSLAILAFAGSIVAIPLIFAPDVEEIARATRGRRDGRADGPLCHAPKMTFTGRRDPRAADRAHRHRLSWLSSYSAPRPPARSSCSPRLRAASSRSSARRRRRAA